MDMHGRNLRYEHNGAASLHQHQLLQVSNLRIFVARIHLWSALLGTRTQPTHCKDESMVTRIPSQGVTRGIRQASGQMSVGETFADCQPESSTMHHWLEDDFGLGPNSSVWSALHFSSIRATLPAEADLKPPGHTSKT